MTRTIGRIGGLLGIVVALSANAAAQDTAEAPSHQRRLSVEATAGLQLDYSGNMQSLALGFAPTRRLTLLVSVERSFVRDEIDYFEDGYAFERGGTERFVSGELRYAFLTSGRVSPYVVGGAGRGISRPTVNEFFPNEHELHIQVFYIGAGVRVPVGKRFDAFADGRAIMSLEAKSDYFGVRVPVRAGIAWRF